MASQSQTHRCLLSTWIMAMTFGTALAFVTMGFGCCPEPKLQPNFDIPRYMGRWFEYVRFPWYFSMGTKCVIANYTLNDDQSVRVVNSGIQEVSYGLGLCPWYKSIVAEGDAIRVDKNDSAKLGVRFSEFSPRGNYWVVETNYDEYAIVYGCSPAVSSALPVYIENAWVLTRKRGVAPKDLAKMYIRLESYGINPGNFELSDHSGCPDWPKPT